MFFLASIFSVKVRVIGVKISVGNTTTVRISGISSHPGFELSRSNCIENITPKPRGMEIRFESVGVRVIWGASYRDCTLKNSIDF